MHELKLKSTYIVASYCMETQKFNFYFKKAQNLILTFAEIPLALSIVGITPTVVNDTRMEMFSLAIYYLWMHSKCFFYRNCGGIFTFN